MTNITTQVSPRNGVDFSRLRRYADGGNIPKYSPGTTEGGIQTMTGIGHGEGTSWGTHMFSLIVGDLKSKLGDPSMSQEDKKLLILEINELQGSYAKIRAAHPTLSSASFDLAVRKYQEDIIKKYNFVNTKGVTYGNLNGRYIYGLKNPLLRTSGDREGINKDWSTSADGIFSGITLDRTLLGYDGDWDETSDDFKSWQSYLNSIGLETFKDADNAYKLREFSGTGASNQSFDKGTNSNSSSISENNIGASNSTGNGSGASSTTAGDGSTSSGYKAVPGTPADTLNKKLRFFTDPIINGATLGLSLANNKRVYDLAMQQKTPLLLFTPKYDIVTGDYTYQNAAQNAFANRMSLANQAATSTSNGDLAYAAQKEGADAVMQGLLQAAEHEAQNFNNLVKENVAVGLYNNQGATEVANLNTLSNAATFNTRLNSRAQYLSKNTEALQDNIMKNHAGYGQWLQHLRLQDYADWQAQEGIKVLADMDQAYKNYKDSGDITKYKGWGDFWKKCATLNSDGTWRLNEDAVSGEDGSLFSVLGSGNESIFDRADALTEDDLKALYGNGTNEFFKDLTTGHNQYKLDALELYQNDTTKIQRRWELTQSRFKPYMLDNQMWRWIDMMQMKPTYDRYFPESMKQGGRISDRFLLYLDHNRKVQDKEKDVIMQSSKLALKLLARDLDALDRETLLLLRSIFK